MRWYCNVSFLTVRRQLVQNMLADLWLILLVSMMGLRVVQAVSIAHGWVYL